MNTIKYAVSITDESVNINTPIMLSGPFEECFRAAAECGYDGVELQIKNPATRDAAELCRLKEQYHLEIPCITTGMEYFGNHLSLISDSPEIQRQAVSRLIEHIDLARELGSMVLLGSMRGVIDHVSRFKDLENRLLENVQEVQKAAEERQVDVVFEPINLYVINYINSLDEGADFVKRVHSPRFWLMIDTHHMRMHDGDMYEAILRNREWIRYVHYSDGNRLYPGGGNINFFQCTRALMETDYQGWITMECLAQDNGKHCARKALEYCRGLEDACRAVLA
jgi:sugar phosphate isomerase/epimerase